MSCVNYYRLGKCKGGVCECMRACMCQCVVKWRKGKSVVDWRGKQERDKVWESCGEIWSRKGKVRLQTRKTFFPLFRERVQQGRICIEGRATHKLGAWTRKAEQWQWRPEWQTGAASAGRGGPSFESFSKVAGLSFTECFACQAIGHLGQAYISS